MLKKTDQQQKFKLGETEIDLNPDHMMFSEVSLSDYYQQESGFYDYYSAQLAYADFLVTTRENNYDALYSEKFHNYKGEGGSDKLAESRAKSDAEVVEAKELVAAAKLKKSLLQQYLRSWDRNHENALALGHMLRKEMDKLNMTVRDRSGHVEISANKMGIKEFDFEEFENEQEAVEGNAN